MTNQEKELLNKLIEFVKTITPPNTVIEINESRWLELAIVCPGRDAIMGYYCCLDPDHPGRCYSRNKQVDFTPRDDDWWK